MNCCGPDLFSAGYNEIQIVDPPIADYHYTVLYNTNSMNGTHMNIYFCILAKSLHPDSDPPGVDIHLIHRRLDEILGR